mmetsp:Transcript_24857/g.52944  ORF Transcript_24857/g.52944 Transcript_24857/m.52944 type:complete len:85 (+) Transcript_24857:170-424(+)
MSPPRLGGQNTVFVRFVENGAKWAELKEPTWLDHAAIFGTQSVAMAKNSTFQLGAMKTMSPQQDTWRTCQVQDNARVCWCKRGE